MISLFSPLFFHIVDHLTEGGHFTRGFAGIRAATSVIRESAKSYPPVGVFLPGKVSSGALSTPRKVQ